MRSKPLFTGNGSSDQTTPKAVSPFPAFPSRSQISLFRILPAPKTKAPCSKSPFPVRLVEPSPKPNIPISLDRVQIITVDTMHKLLQRLHRNPHDESLEQAAAAAAAVADDIGRPSPPRAFEPRLISGTRIYKTNDSSEDVDSTQLFCVYWTDTV